MSVAQYYDCDSISHCLMSVAQYYDCDSISHCLMSVAQYYDCDSISHCLMSHSTVQVYYKSGDHHKLLKCRNKANGIIQ